MREMNMKFAVGMGFDLGMHEVVCYARCAEESGFSHLAFIDTPAVARDVHVMMAVAAEHTSHILIGQGVTDPSTIHPLVVANATASIDELSAGRAFVGIGAGGPFGKMMKARPLNEVREAIDFIRTYTAGEDARWRDASIRSTWVNRRLPIYMACNGPNACRLAGEIADGVMIGGPIDPGVVEWKLELIRDGAAKAGRVLSDIDVWLTTTIGIDDSKQRAVQRLSSFALTKARGVYSQLQNPSPENTHLREILTRDEPGMIEELERLFEMYDPYKVESAQNLDDGTVSESVADMFLLAGTAREVRERISNLGELGVNRIFTVLPGGVDGVALMREIAAGVISHSLA